MLQISPPAEGIEIEKTWSRLVASVKDGCTWEGSIAIFFI